MTAAQPRKLAERGGASLVACGRLHLIKVFRQRPESQKVGHKRLPLHLHGKPELVDSIHLEPEPVGVARVPPDRVVGALIAFSLFSFSFSTDSITCGHGVISASFPLWCAFRRRSVFARALQKCKSAGYEVVDHFKHELIYALSGRSSRSFMNRRNISRYISLFSSYMSAVGSWPASIFPTTPAARCSLTQKRGAGMRVDVLKALLRSIFDCTAIASLKFLSRNWFRWSLNSATELGLRIVVEVYSLCFRGKVNIKRLE